MIHQVINAYALGGGGGGPASYDLTSFAAGPVSPTSGNTLTLASLAVTAGQFTANATYLGLASAELLRASTAGATRMFVNDGSTDLTRANINFKNVSTPQDKRAVCSLFRFQPGASPANTTFDLKIEAQAGATSTGQNGRVTLLKLGSDDFSAIDLTGGTRSSSSYATFLTLNFTPASSGDYIILGYCRAGSNGGGRYSRVKMVCGGQTIEYYGLPADSSDNPFLFILPLTALSGAQTATLEMASDGIGTVTIDELHLFAIRRDQFDAVYTAKLGATASGTETTYTEAHATTNTPAAVPHLTIAGWGQGGSSTTETIYSQFTDDGSVIAENIAEPRNSSADRNVMCGAHTVATYSAASRKQAIDRKSESGATSRIQQNAGIAVFNLNGF
jgi:hypothetical protein